MHIRALTILFFMSTPVAAQETVTLSHEDFLTLAMGSSRGCETEAAAAALGTSARKAGVSPETMIGAAYFDYSRGALPAFVHDATLLKSANDAVLSLSRDIDRYTSRPAAAEDRIIVDMIECKRDLRAIVQKYTK